MAAFSAHERMSDQDRPWHGQWVSIEDGIPEDVVLAIAARRGMGPECVAVDFDDRFDIDAVYLAPPED